MWILLRCLFLESGFVNIGEWWRLRLRPLRRLLLQLCSPPLAHLTLWAILVPDQALRTVGSVERAAARLKEGATALRLRLRGVPCLNV